MVTRNRAHPQSAAHDPGALIAAHESIANVFAAQGDWRRAYEHLRSALDHAQAELPARPHIPEQYRREVEQLRRETARARHESLTDALTAAYNRRYLDRTLAELRSPAVALIDLDHFKDTNDTFGHEVGDRVLQRVVALLRRHLPHGAFCARYGGEEFALVLPRSAAHSAVALAERVRSQVADYDWSEVRPGLSVTISVGVAPTPPDGGDPYAQLREADTLLYEAKRAGRNLVAFRENGRVRLLRTLSAHAARPCS
ncbi:GGDEF domain-containing protein [Prauserella oleivorans]|uniref:GGDEF domain-containing protein n=1 Tax=Prauserella oleivorans TaxID=1478153 RepID=A0ABW5W8Z3_9PSEU